MTPAPIRVAVVDDHPVVRGGLAALLASADDIDVVGQAADGEAAVELAIAERPDVVLMDLRMPVLDGVGATARIREEAPDVRVLVLTTYETDASILTAIEAGASGYLLKAAPEEEILAGVRAVARGEVALAPAIAAALVRQVGRPAAGPATPTPTLSPRETEVLALVAAGRTNARIARELHVTPATVKTHLLHVFEKLGVGDRTRAVTLAMELGLLPAAARPTRG
ncbi:response regulator transcription factor [Clavibacter michiganensis]|uniref:response regulator transcription factor n=1 Tax=Clavibacter michiganensis TaxID=28447 RepID=UPI0009A59268|nr:response regulator transcription factor [Clavibacter michiganensis]KAF0257032.1 Transcriptional regulatory protein LiaR [Clavibacter michiganensis subsp. michiganensis]MBF4636499.1 response regulator transcription factor [Clavibacter michiganensis subsp. michiganensis]MDO4123788.1 response regulator transcription factor [Clavibacter michiganensis]MDO4138812.1 response regulator transcription factor [Clavibacter michiganensis]MWJ07128.1 DNA-binding response regulator [Clavibacter michiganens